MASTASGLWVDYVAAAVGATVRQNIGHWDAATAACIALKIGQPLLTDGQLAVQVLNELGSITGGSTHPELVPGAKPIFRWPVNLTRGYVRSFTRSEKAVIADQEWLAVLARDQLSPV